jgi:hypothetical protein
MLHTLLCSVVLLLALATPAAADPLVDPLLEVTSGVVWNWAGPDASVSLQGEGWTLLSPGPYPLGLDGAALFLPTFTVDGEVTEQAALDDPQNRDGVYGVLSFQHALVFPDWQAGETAEAPFAMTGHVDFGEGHAAFDLAGHGWLWVGPDPERTDSWPFTIRFTFLPAAVPEPATAWLLGAGLGVGLGGLWLARRPARGDARAVHVSTL